MADDEYVPLVEKEREHKSRVHEELTQPARERITVITEDIEDSQKKDSIEFLMSKIGRSPVAKSVNNTDEAKEIGISKIHRRFIESGTTVHVLTYLEKLVKEYHLGELDGQNISVGFNSGETVNVSTETEPLEKTSELIEEIREILITEGILWNIEMAGSGGVIQFVPLESESMEEIDQKVRALAQDGPWDEALKGYNTAFERYLSGNFDDTLVAKLYYSIEEVLKIICVDLENWTDDRERSHGYYLDLLNTHDIYNANGITAPELNQLLDSLEKMVSKVGNDRKQRHTYHDRAYCTLLIHQVGAYLYFIISRYDDSKS